MNKGNWWERQLISLFFSYLYIDKKKRHFILPAKKLYIFRRAYYPNQYELEFCLNLHFSLLMPSYDFKNCKGVNLD